MGTAERSYTELLKLPTFKERFTYLDLTGMVGEATFGYDRYLNQILYHSRMWKDIRRFVIARDLGCDLGCEDMPIPGKILIHHMNPIDKLDISERSSLVIDPEYLICVSHETHNALHYGTLPPKADPWVERKPNDTIPWR